MVHESSSSSTTVAGNSIRLIPCRRYGKSYLRRSPLAFKDAGTTSQLLQRGRMNAVVAFYNNLPPLPLKCVWKIAARKGGCSGYNLFVGYNINAFDAEGRIFDYSAIILSTGRLSLPTHVEAAAGADNTAVITWDEVPGETYARLSDRLVVAVIYDYAPFEVFFCLTDGFLRQEHRAIVPLNRQPGDTAHLYVFFRTEKSDQFSNQRYFKLD